MPNNQWEQFGFQQANNLVGVGMGLALEGHNDRRQIKQQQRLQALQLQGNQAMTDYNMNKQYEMWQKTNYSAQMEQLKKAGLNPGLMYGMGGGGGVTTGQAAGQVSGSEAPKGGGEIIAQQGMGIQQMAQLKLLQAQKENIEADTANKQADTVNKPIQGKNIEADTENKITQNFIMEIERDIKGATSNAAKGLILHNLRITYEEMEMKIKEGVMKQDQLQTQLNLQKAQAAKIYIDNELTQAQTKLSGTENEKKTQEIEAIKAEIRQMTDPKAIENYFERERLRLMEKGINVAIIGSVLGTILNFAKPAGKGITINK